VKLEPQTGFGQTGSFSLRAMRWMCIWRIWFPMQATLSLVEVFDGGVVGFRDDDEPGEGGFVFEEDVTAIEGGERDAAFEEAGVDLEAHTLLEK